MPPVVGQPAPDFTRRAYYLIDQQGILRWMHTEAELGHRRQDDELLAEIRKLPQPAVSAR